MELHLADGGQCFGLREVSIEVLEFKRETSSHMFGLYCIWGNTFLNKLYIPVYSMWITGHIYFKFAENDFHNFCRIICCLLYTLYVHVHTG